MSSAISTLNRLYQYVTTHPSCDFYRNFYGPNRPEAITSLEDWQSLPILTKEYIGTIPYAERLFTHNADVRAVRITSGTSGSRPIVFPRNYLQQYKDYMQWLGPNHGILIFHTSQSYLYEASPQHILTGDNSQPHKSIEMALATGVDTIMASLSVLKIIAAHLSMDAATQIKNIVCSGETLTAYDRELLTNTFTEARILITYGLSESQGDAGYMEITAPQSAHTYTPNTDFYLETSSTTNELLLSHKVYTPNPFPFLKYNTGDIVEAEYNQDASVQSFTIRGRSSLDTVNIPGGQLQTSEIERCLQSAHPDFTGDFRAFYRIGSDEKLVLTLHIHSKTGDTPVTTHTNLADYIAGLLKVRADYTYADGVAAGIYTPLDCAVVQSFPESAHKTIRIQKCE